MSNKIIQGRFLNKFYEKFSDSMINLSPNFRLSSFECGSGFLSDSEPPQLLEIPMTLESLPETFLTGRTPVVARNGAQLIIQCPITPGDVSEAHKFSMVGIRDQDNDLVIAGVALPFYVHEDSEHTTTVYINLPIQN